MKIAEALSARADAQRRVERLRSRIVANARYQEGEEPSEDAAALVVGAERVLDELQTWIARINRTNAARADHGYRQLRSELRQLSAPPVRELRTRADDVATQLRELHVRLRQADLTRDLLGPVLQIMAPVHGRIVA